jgi:hypothetical protein
MFFFGGRCIIYSDDIREPIISARTSVRLLSSPGDFSNKYKIADFISIVLILPSSFTVITLKILYLTFIFIFNKEIISLSIAVYKRQTR